MSVTKKIITITIDQDYYRILKQRKIRVSTLIHRLLTKYLTEDKDGLSV